MLETLKLSKSDYYRWTSNKPRKREARYNKMDRCIRNIYSTHKGRYGSTRIVKELNFEYGIGAKRQTVAHRMKIMKLVPKGKPKFKVTTDSNHKNPVAENLLQQDFSASHPNKKWVTDISYIRTQEGWLYLCIILDLHSRKIIGWSMDKSMRAELCCDALLMALWKRRFPKNVIVHSDRGSQYCSEQFQELMKLHSLSSSMSGKGCCFDNAPCESFFRTIKVELAHDENYETREEAKRSLFDYIECYYNKKRRHSGINYMTPDEFECNIKLEDSA